MATKHPNFRPLMGYSQCGKRYTRRPLSPVTRDPLGCSFITLWYNNNMQTITNNSRSLHHVQGPFEAPKKCQSGPKRAQNHCLRRFYPVIDDEQANFCGHILNNYTINIFSMCQLANRLRTRANRQTEWQMAKTGFVQLKFNRYQRDHTAAAGTLAGQLIKVDSDG